MGAGVWRCRAYLRFGYGSVTFSRRGAALGALAFGFSWFVVNRDVWLSRLKPAADFSQAWLALASARRAIDTEGLGARLSELAGRNRLLVVSMANSPHVDLAINMAYSAMRAGLPPTIIFALSEAAEARLAFAGIETARLASNRALDIHRDVQSPGFGAVAAMKAVCVLSVLRAGVDAWWIDTDVVFFDKSFVSKQLLSVDMIFQSGGYEITRGEDHFHVEACTGVYFARARPAVVALLEAVIVELQLAAELQLDWFGDQAATNLVLFEKRFRSFPELNVDFLDPIDAPSGGLFFGGLLTTRDRAQAKLAHNNFVIGYKAKLDRFEAAGLWFDSSQPRHITRSLQRAKFAPKHACELASLIIGGRRPSRRPLLKNIREEHAQGGDFVVFAVEQDLCTASTKAIATVSLGDRPWFWLHLAPRLAEYSRRIRADLVVQSSPYPVPNAKRYKLDLAASLLGIYRRCLLLDDTVAIRNDSPDLFQFVPPLALGALVEDNRIRTAEENAALLALARMSYDTTFGLHDYNPMPSPDIFWLNSGVLVLSWLHTALVDAAHIDLDDAALYWDQVHRFGLQASLLDVALRRRRSSTLCAPNLVFPSSISATNSTISAPSRLRIEPRYGDSHAFSVNSQVRLPSTPATHSLCMALLASSWTLTTAQSTSAISLDNGHIPDFSRLKLE